MATNFSTADTYALKSQWYSDLGDNALAKIYWDLANNLWAYSAYGNNTISAYDNLLNFMSWNENKLQSVAWSLYNELVNDINNQRTYINNTFGPEWTLTKEVDKYYDDLWNYLATDAWRQAAIIAAQWQHSWASLWAIRAQQNEAYNQSFQRYVQAKEQQINAKQQIASNLINFMSTLRQEYWNTTNQYIIEMYKRAYDLYNNTALSLAQDLDNYNKLRISSRWSGWSGWSSDLLSSLLNNSNSNNGNNNSNWITKSAEDAYSNWVNTLFGGSSSSNNSELGENLNKANNKDYAKNILNYAALALTAPYPWGWAMLGALNSLKNRKTK